jgi:hypothetical protein
VSRWWAAVGRREVDGWMHGWVARRRAVLLSSDPLLRSVSFRATTSSSTSVSSTPRTPRYTFLLLCTARMTRMICCDRKRRGDTLEPRDFTDIMLPNSGVKKTKEYYTHWQLGRSGKTHPSAANPLVVVSSHVYNSISRFIFRINICISSNLPATTCVT